MSHNKVVEDDGFEPPNSMRADLQSAVFSHFTNPPYKRCRREDLNPQPTDYKSVALPVELQRRKLFWWWLGTESNRRHEDFQSSALPTELPSRELIHHNGGADGIRTRGLLRDRQACWATTPQLHVMQL
jgi:hypothetical protein